MKLHKKVKVAVQKLVSIHQHPGSDWH